MNDEIKKELDQIGNLVDSKIEKAFNSAKDNAKGEIETSLKSEIDNLSNEFLSDFVAAKTCYGFENENNYLINRNFFYNFLEITSVIIRIFTYGNKFCNVSSFFFEFFGFFFC